MGWGKRRHIVGDAKEVGNLWFSAQAIISNCCSRRLAAAKSDRRICCRRHLRVGRSSFLWES